MESVIGRLLNAARKYNAWDYAFFKLTLLGAGILLGTYFHEFFRSGIAVVWIVFVVSYLWIAYQTFFRYLR